MPEQPNPDNVEMFSYQDAFGGHVAGVRPKQDALSAKDVRIEELEHAVETQAQRIEDLEKQNHEYRKWVLDLTEKWGRPQFVIEDEQHQEHVAAHKAMCKDALVAQNMALQEQLFNAQNWSLAIAIILMSAGAVLGKWVL